jgi:iron complex transport system substrate-binding protein
MKRLPMSILVAVALLAGPLLGACGGPPAEAPPPSPSPEAGPLASEVTVVDALGRTIQFPEPPQRIVLAGKSTLTVANTLYLFPEAGERVVAVVAGRQNPAAFLGFVDPTFEEKTILEVDAGPEQIAPLDPDVVVLRSSMAEKLGRALEKLDIPVVYVDLETPEQFVRDLGTLGQLFGNEARAAEIQAFYQSRLDRVAQALQGVGEAQRPRILLLQHSDQGGLIAFNVPSASWIQTAEVKLAGGIPVWVEAAQGGGWTVVNFEQIAAWDPDKIFVVSCQADSAGIVDELETDPRWQALRAVREGQVYSFAGDIYSWDQPDPRWIVGVMWLAGKLHPERLAELDIMQEVAQFFEEMYGLDQASIEAHILPSLKGDVP